MLRGFDLGAEDYVTKPFHMQILLRRVEVAAPILDPDLRRRLGEMFQIMLRDNQQARELRPTGEYVRMHNQEDPLNAQEFFYQQAYEQAAMEQPEPKPAAPAGGKHPHSIGRWFHWALGKSGNEL